MKKTKVLISAYACSPYHGSEPGMGWNFIKSVSNYHEVHVITEEYEFRNDIEKFLEENPRYNNIKFHYIPRKHYNRLRKFWPPSYYWFYRLWQKKVYSLAKSLDEEHHFDVFHQLNMVGFREPGYLWKIDKGFVWGPIGGMSNIDFRLLLNLDMKNFIYYGVRNLINLLHKYLLVRPKMASRRSNKILISATESVKNDIYKLWRQKSFVMPEVGREENSVGNVKFRGPKDPLRIIWCGQHTGGKALNILLKALACYNKHDNWELAIVGCGSMTNKWKKLARKIGISDRCQWYGWLEKGVVHHIMRESHLMVITSLKDLTATVTLEGLSFGLPIVCIDHCGFSFVINDSCGIKIPISFPKKLIQDFGKSIKTICENEIFRRRLAEGAIKRSKEFSWDMKAKKLSSFYQKVHKRNANEK